MPRRYKDSQGNIIEVADDGTVTVVEEAAQPVPEPTLQQPQLPSTQAQQLISPQAELRTATPPGVAALNYLPTITGFGAGLIGGLAGGPIGTAAMGTAGATVGETLRNTFLQHIAPPELRPTNEQVFANVTGELLGSALGETIAGGVGRLISRVPLTRAFISRQLVNRFGQRSPQFEQFLKDNPNIPVSVGQITNSPVLKFLEDVVSTGKKVNLVRVQQDLVGDLATKAVASFHPSGTNIEDVGNELIRNLRDGSMMYRNIENNLYTQVRNIASKTKLAQKGLPGSQVTGPVVLNKTIAVLSDILENLPTVTNLTELRSLLAAKDKKFAIYLDAIADVYKRGTAPTPVPFEFAQTMKSILGREGKSALTVPPQHQRKLQEVASAITEDIEDSMRKFWTDGEHAAQLFSSARSVATQRRHLFNETNIIKRLLKQQNVSDDIDELIKDHNKLDAVLEASASPDVTRRLLAANYLDNLFQKSKTVTKDGVVGIDIGKAATEFANRKAEPSVRRLFTTSQRANIETLLTTLDRLKPEVSTASRWALHWRAGMGLGIAAISLGPSLYRLGTEGTLKKPTTLEQVGILFVLGRLATNKILLDPKLTRIAADLAHTPKESFKARHSVRALLYGLRGYDVYIKNLDGVTLSQGIIDDNGRVTIPPLE